MAFGRLIQFQHPTNWNQQNVNYSDDNSPHLYKTKITGSILNSYATLTYVEEFKTKKDDFYEIYINPPEGCVVYDIKAKHDDKTTEFVIHQLEEPVSDGIINSNSNSDAITLTLGHIKSDIAVVIEISCTFTAILTSSNSFTFHFPSEDSLFETNFSANIKIANSNRNQSKIKISEGYFTIKEGHLIVPTCQLTHDFSITFEFSEPIQSTAFSTRIGKHNYIGLSLLPVSSFFNESEIKQEIYLLIDCSGSMAGSKIKSAQKTLKDFLKGLPKNCYFNILRFGSTFEQMFECSVENNEDNISQSLKYANSLDADLGGTDIYSPLMSIIDEKPRPGYVRQVFALTDGVVESPANVIASCTKNRHIMRVFPIGIGSDVNHAFLEELAKSTMGNAHFINNTSKISDEVLATLKSSQVGAIVNGQIHIEGIDSFEFAPHPIPSMFADNLAHVIIRYESVGNEFSGSILVNGEYGDDSYEETISIERNDDIMINLEKLFAYHNIRDMEDHLLSLENPDDAKIIKENIIQLSKQCAVVSSFTGMFTVINGIEQKPEDLQKEMEKYNEELTKQQLIQPQPQQQMFFQPQPQQPMLFQHQPQQQMLFQPQPQQLMLFQHQPQQPILFQQQSQFMQQFQPQQMYFQPQQFCQQPMTQKQARNQRAFAQVSQPKQQLKQIWGNKQILQSNPPKVTKQQIQTNKKVVVTKQMITKDHFIENLMKKQNSNGSWNDISLIPLLVNLNTKNPTIKDIFNEFPSILKRFQGMSDQFIMTLLVIGWLYEQNLVQNKQYKTKVQKGIDYMRLFSNQDFTQENHFLTGVSWKNYN